jgi:hypothetical protein
MHPSIGAHLAREESGETTLLDVVGELVPRALSTANVTSAAVFRTIEVARPTLLIDEADTFLGQNEELIY